MLGLSKAGMSARPCVGVAAGAAAAAGAEQPLSVSEAALTTAGAAAAAAAVEGESPVSEAKTEPNAAYTVGDTVGTAAVAVAVAAVASAGVAAAETVVTSEVVAVGGVVVATWIRETQCDTACAAAAAESRSRCFASSTIVSSPSSDAKPGRMGICLLPDATVAATAA
jgi:hypothetical protein